MDLCCGRGGKKMLALLSIRPYHSVPEFADRAERGSNKLTFLELCLLHLSDYVL